MSNLYKAGWVVMEDDARIIDTNELVEKKLREAERKHYVPSAANAEEEGFTGGLPTEKVEALLDQDAETAVLKSASLEEKEAVQAQLEQAKNELEEAKQQAAQILEDAQQQAEALHQQTYQEALKKGRADGYEQGMRQVQELKEEWEAKKQELLQDYNKKMADLEPAFVENLTDIYEHIFRVDLSSYKGLVENLIMDAMQKIETTGNLIVHVSREAYKPVSEAKGRLLEATGILQERLEIVPDMTLKEAQCMIETENGVYDCSLGTELEELSRKLRLLSYRGGKNHDAGN